MQSSQSMLQYKLTSECTSFHYFRELSCGVHLIAVKKSRIGSSSSDMTLGAEAMLLYYHKHVGSIIH